MSADFSTFRAAVKLSQLAAVSATYRKAFFSAYFSTQLPANRPTQWTAVRESKQSTKQSSICAADWSPDEPTVCSTNLIPFITTDYTSQFAAFWTTNWFAKHATNSTAY
jgi:hypothetical protein